MAVALLVVIRYHVGTGCWTTGEYYGLVRPDSSQSPTGFPFAPDHRTEESMNLSMTANTVALFSEYLRTRHNSRNRHGHSVG